MTCRPVWLAASCCALLLLAPHPAAAAGGALELSDANFESETQASSSDGGPWMIEFYAPYCGHCKAISQAWDDTADSLADKGVKVAKIDGTANRKQAQRFGVRGFPKIMLVKGGVRYDYSGDRTEEAFSEFALGDYQKEGGEAGVVILPPRSPVMAVYDEIVEAFEQIRKLWDRDFGACLVLTMIGFMLGMTFMIMVDSCMQCCQRAPRQMVWVDSKGNRIAAPRAPEGATAMPLDEFTKKK